MADAPPTNVAPATVVSPSEVTNAQMRNQVTGKLIETLSGGNGDVVTALAAIATAITNSIIGGTTGGTADRVLTSKGMTGFALQATPVTIAQSTGNTSGIGTLAIGGALSGATTITQSSYHDYTEIASPSSPAANILRLYSLDQSGTTRLAYKDSGGTETVLGATPSATTMQAFFTTGGTWTKPTGCRSILVFATGPGGTGGTDPSGFGAAGGGGGATGIKLIDVTAITSETVTIPAAGSGSATTFGAHISAGAGANASGTTPGAGGTATSGTINVRGQAGSQVSSVSTSGPGGGSFWGGGAQTQSGTGAGIAALVYGAGGSGGNAGGGSSQAGGAGVAGVVMVVEFY